MNKKHKIAIAAILLCGAAASALILFGGKRSAHPAGEHDDHDEAEAAHVDSGPHGGQLASKEGVTAEIVLNEQGESPRLEVYLSRQGTAWIAPPADVTVTLVRPGAAREQLALQAAGQGLASTVSIEEPHVFDGTVALRSDGKVLAIPFAMHEGKINISDAQIAASSIAVQPSGPARISSSVVLPGEIRLNADRTVAIVPRLGGVVESVAVSLGDKVRKGQVLATIASAEAAQLRADLQAAQSRLALARATLEREKKLWEEKISAEQDYLQARQAMREAEIAVQGGRQKLVASGAAAAAPGALARYQLLAPIDGTVVDKQVAAGESASEAKSLLTISDLSSVWMDVIVPARDLATVRSGAGAEVRASAFDSTASGKVSYVSALMGEQTRTANARIVVPNPGGVWRPGLLANAEIGTGQRDVPTAVAAQALHSLDGRTVVFIRVPGGFVAQPVTAGVTDGRFVEIVKGLNPGVPYASTNSNVIKAEGDKADAAHAH